MNINKLLKLMIMLGKGLAIFFLFFVLYFCTREIIYTGKIGENGDESKNDEKNKLGFFYLEKIPSINLQTVYTFGSTTVDFSNPSIVNMDRRIYGHNGKFYYGSGFYGRCLFVGDGNYTGHKCSLVEYANDGKIVGWIENMGSYGDVTDMDFSGDYIFVASDESSNWSVNLSIYNINDLSKRVRRVTSFINQEGAMEYVLVRKVVCIGDKVYVSSSGSNITYSNQVVIFSKSYLVDPSVSGSNNLKSIGVIGNKNESYNIETNNKNNLLLGTVVSLSRVDDLLLICSLIGTNKYKVDIYRDDKYITSIFNYKDVDGNSHDIGDISASGFDKYVAILSKFGTSGNTLIVLEKSSLLKEEDRVAKFIYEDSGDISLNLATLQDDKLVINNHSKRLLDVYMFRIKYFNLKEKL